MIICKETGENQAEEIMDVPKWKFKHLIHSNDGDTAVVVEVIEESKHEE